MYSLIRPWLFAFEPERAHAMGLMGLNALHQLGVLKLFTSAPLSPPIRVFNIDFPNPVGLAAGFDKNGQYIDALAALGFGFIEVGTVTPRPQQGHEKPRLFRLPKHQAIINRMGFNNDGVDKLLQTLEQSSFQGVLGINIGKNKDTPDENAIDDYRFCLRRVYPRATYVTANISSPNTQGLRELQNQHFFDRFVGELREEQEKLAGQHGALKPLLIKIAPDLDEQMMDNIALILLRHRVDGLICTNTTTDRNELQNTIYAEQAGGLSGRPLFTKSTNIVREMAARLSGKVPIVGVGGIMHAEDAVTKVKAGATLVQIYTGLIYQGPALVHKAALALRNLATE
jgi:dihydroorotate dehydrogenase